MAAQAAELGISYFLSTIKLISAIECVNGEQMKKMLTDAKLDN